MKKLAEVGKMGRFTIGGLLALVFFLISAGAQASTVDFIATHNLSFSISPGLNFQSGTIYSGVTGEANGVTKSKTASTALVSGAASAVANAPTNADLAKGYASTSSNGHASATIYHDFQGKGPNPDNGGDITQYNSHGTIYLQEWYMQFTVPTTGNYSITLTDVYNLSFSLNQATGSLYPFTELSRSSWIYLNIANNDSFGTTNYDRIYNVTTGNGTSPIGPISDTVSNTAQVKFPSWAADEGTTLKVSAWVVDMYEGTTQTSPAPVPPTLLLLGSGLVGLLVLRRRQKASKS